MTLISTPFLNENVISAFLPGRYSLHSFCQRHWWVHDQKMSAENEHKTPFCTRAHWHPVSLVPTATSKSSGVEEQLCWVPSQRHQGCCLSYWAVQSSKGASAPVLRTWHPHTIALPVWEWPSRGICSHKLRASCSCSALGSYLVHHFQEFGFTGVGILLNDTIRYH